MNEPLQDRSPRTPSPIYEWVPQLPEELIAAVMDDDVAKLQSLQEAGASLNVIQSGNHSGNSLLIQAIRHKKAAVFGYLLTLEDVPLDSGYMCASPIEWTFKHATEDFALKLIERGCYIDCEDSNGDTLLHHAISAKWIAMAEKLIEEGVDVDYKNERGETPLLLACQNHLVDEVFMLLFYGANPSIKDYWRRSPLDMLAIHNDDKMQDSFVNTLYPHYKVLTLETVVNVMEKGSVIVPKLLENTADIIILNRDSLQLLAEGIPKFSPEYFKLFVDKFTDIVEQVFGALPVVVFFRDDVSNFKIHHYVENLYTILNHRILCPQFVDTIDRDSYRVVDSLIEIFKKRGGELETLTKLVCCFLTHGICLHQDDLYTAFTTYGYYALFKIMLHMDIDDELCYFKPIMPALIYDVNISVEGFVKYCGTSKIWELFDDEDCYQCGLCDPFFTLLEYFAVPELKTFFMELNNEKLTARLQQLPSVPSLVELARNSARAYIINKYSTKNSSQFYTVLNHMPIPKVLKQIIAFERKLYLATNT